MDLKQGLLHVNRLKHGVASTHPLRGPELRALRKVQRDYPLSPYVFTTERNGPLTASAVRKLTARAGEAIEQGGPRRLQAIGHKWPDTIPDHLGSLMRPAEPTHGVWLRSTHASDGSFARVRPQGSETMA